MKIFLLFFSIHIVQNQKCDRKILENYGIVSLLQPSKEKIVFCPNIKASCCPSYEQFKIQQIYQQQLKPHFKKRFELIKHELILLQQTITPLFQPNGELEQKIQAIKSVALKRQAKDLMSQLRVHKFDFLVSKALEHQDKAFQYITNLKNTFFCTVCDFDAQKFMNFEQKNIIFNNESCDELVNNTLMYSSILNRGIVIFLQNLSNLLNKFDLKNKAINVPNIGGVISAIKECSNEFKETEKDLTSCRNYCSYYKLNSDLPVFEGYPEFFFNILVQLKMNFAPKQTNRILEALRNIKEINEDKIILRKNQQSYQRKKQHYQQIIGLLNNLYGSRVLEEDQNFIDDLNPELWKENELLMDPFDEELSMKLFDERMMSKMLKIQNQLYNGEPQDLQKIIKTYIAESYNPEIEDIENSDIFKMASNQLANLEKLKSKFAFGGINFKEIIHTMNWNLQFHDIVLSLAGKHHSVGNDKIDQNLLIFINRVRNENVNDFHEDNFLNFAQQKEFFIQDYHNSKKESDTLKIIKEKTKFEKAHQLLRDYNLENVDAIITELNKKAIEKSQQKIQEMDIKNKVDKAKQKVYQLIQKEEEKLQQEKDFQKNKKFLQELFLQKGLKGVIKDLRDQNSEISQQNLAKLPENNPENQITEQQQKIQQTNPEINKEQKQIQFIYKLLI